MYKDKTICAIVQARMGSRRLPNKSLLWLYGFPIIGLIYQRLRLSSFIDSIIFAIPDSPQDYPLYLYLKQNSCTIYRGSESDVLTRFYQASTLVKADYFLRICADNPLICPIEVDHLISNFYHHPSDYAYNHVPLNNTYPDGLGCEIVTASTLHSIYSLAKLASHREHIFNYITDNQTQFTIGTTEPSCPSVSAPSLRFDIDTPLDYAYLLELPLHSPLSSGTEIVSAAKDRLNHQPLV